MLRKLQSSLGSIKSLGSNLHGEYARRTTKAHKFVGLYKRNAKNVANRASQFDEWTIQIVFGANFVGQGETYPLTLAYDVHAFHCHLSFANQLTRY